MGTRVLLPRHFDDELAVLHGRLIEMWNIVEEQVAAAVDAVINADVELARDVVARDRELDRLELEVDRQCARMLALFTPVAVDLRRIISAVKVNMHLERMGDYAKNLVKDTAALKRCTDLIPKTCIRGMADTARRLLRDAHDAFESGDQVLARKVVAQDRQVDRMHDEMVGKISELIPVHPDRAEDFVYLLRMTKCVERIADHAKNVGKIVVFLVEGIDIRHRGVRRAPIGIRS